jgi:hypothetical protein
MQKPILTGVMVLLLGLSSAGNTEPLPAPAEVILNFSTEGDQGQVHLGELIPVKFSYSAATAGRYIRVSQNHKLTAGHGLEVTCSPPVDPVRRSPAMTVVDDRFGKMLNPCGGVGGGFGGGCTHCDQEQPLTTTPISFGLVPLNTYVRFRTAGTYTCIAASADVTTASSEEKIRSALLVKSNPVDLTIVEDAAWADSAARAYAEAYDELCRGDDVPEHRRLDSMPGPR